MLFCRQSRAIHCTQMRLSSASTALGRLSVLTVYFSAALVHAQPAPLGLLRPPGATLGEGFSSIGWVRELSDGRVIIADPAERRLVVADFTSGRLEEVSRVGRGPGEFQSVSALIPLGGDSTLIEDRRGRRWIVLDGIRQVATVSIPPVVRPSNSALAGADRHGRLLDLQATSFRRSRGVPFSEMRQNAESLIVTVRRRVAGAPGRLGPRVDTLQVLHGRGRGQTVAMRSPGNGAPSMQWLLENPLSAEEQALLFLDGWIAIVFADPYRVDWIMPSGERIRGAPIREPMVPLEHRLKVEFISWQWPKVEPPFTPDELPPWPKVVPPFLNDALVGAPDGRLLIRRTFNPNSPETRYDVIERNGSRSGQLALKWNERLVGAGVKFAYVVLKDADDAEWLRRHTWQQ